MKLNFLLQCLICDEWILVDFNFIKIKFVVADGLVKKEVVNKRTIKEISYSEKPVFCTETI